MSITTKDYNMSKPKISIIGIGFLVLLISGISLLQCNKGILIADWVSTVKGTVTDSITGAPLDSAEVFYSDSYFVYADSLGEYQISDLGNPPPQVGCRRDGYITKTISLDIVTGKRLYDSTNFQLVLIP